MANIQRTFANIMGAIFVLIGVWGMFQNPVMGLFQVDTLHNWAHILLGVALLIAANVADGTYARNTTITVGFVYLFLAVLGWLNLIPPALMEVNTADDLLHTVLAVLLLGVGYGVGRD